MKALHSPFFLLVFFVNTAIAQTNKPREVVKDSASARSDTLQEVVMRSKQQVIEIGSDPNTLVYNVSASADAAGQTALETLKKAPGYLSIHRRL